MSQAVFVDTSAWVGCFSARDQHHRGAVAAFQELERGNRRLATTDHVLAETVTLLRKYEGVSTADRVWELLEDGGLASLVEVERRHRARARDVFRRYAQLGLSCADATSVAVMQELDIREILTFDEEFGKVGFTVLPRRRK